jgi:uncharacterized membrane protein YfcA
LRDAAVDIRPLRESRDYRGLYLGTAVSFIGSQITFVAVPFQMFDLPGSSVAVGVIGLCQLVPIAGLSLIGGAIADAVDRRLLLATEAGLALCSVLLAVNSLARPPRLWVIYVLVSISAGLFAIGLSAIRSAADRDPPVVHPRASPGPVDRHRAARGCERAEPRRFRSRRGRGTDDREGERRVGAVSGGIACIVGVGIMALLLPAFARYEAT